jgi:hypothetical protein
MHINKRDNGFRFQESRLRRFWNLAAIWVGVLLTAGGALTLMIRGQAWQAGILAIFGGIVLVVVQVSIRSDRSLYGRDAQGRNGAAHSWTSGETRGSTVATP